MGNKYLVTSSYKDEWFFMVIPLILFIFKEKIGKYLLVAWLSMWFIIQFLSHEWYMIFGSGFMGSTEGKIKYFENALKFIDSDTRYIADVYHIILHLLIMISLIAIIIYGVGKKEKNLE